MLQILTYHLPNLIYKQTFRGKEREREIIYKRYTPHRDQFSLTYVVDARIRQTKYVIILAQ